MNDDVETPAQHPREQETTPPSPPTPTNPFTRPINLGALDKPIDLDEWREFFSVTGGSLLYCLSAMCVLYGFAAILGPVFARSFELVETLPCIVGLNVYEIALMTVLVVIVVWQDVTDDAISLVVLAAIFLMVSGIALTTTSNSDPRSVFLIGTGCFVLAMGKLFVLRRFVGMHVGPVLFAGLVVVLAWNFLAGALFAEAVANDRLVKGVAWAKWGQSWLVLLAGALVVLADAMLRGRRSADATDMRVPFLRRPAMGWVFALVLLAAAGVHQYALAYVFDVRPTFVAFLPLVCILSLLALQLALHLRRVHGALEPALAAFPLAVFLYSLIREPVFHSPVVGIGLVWYPPVFLGLTGVAVLLMSRRCRALLGVVPFYALGVVLTFTFGAATPPDLHWHLAGVLLGCGLLALGLLRRSETLCVLGVLVGTVTLATTQGFEGYVHAWDLSRAGAALGVAGIATLVVAMLLGRLHPSALVAAAVAVVICVFDFLPTDLGARDLVMTFVILALGAGVWLRLHHRPTIGVLGVPLLYRVAVASARLASWRYVVLGFALLFAGAYFSIRKGKRAKREAPPTAPAQAETPPASASRPDATDDHLSPPPTGS